MVMVMLLAMIIKTMMMTMGGVCVDGDSYDQAMLMMSSGRGCMVCSVGPMLSIALVPGQRSCSDGRLSA